MYLDPILNYCNPKSRQHYPVLKIYFCSCLLLISSINNEKQCSWFASQLFSSSLCFNWSNSISFGGKNELTFTETT